MRLPHGVLSGSAVLCLVFSSHAVFDDPCNIDANCGVDCCDNGISGTQTCSGFPRGSRSNGQPALRACACAVGSPFDPFKVICGACTTHADCDGDKCCDGPECSIYDFQTRGLGQDAVFMCECQPTLTLMGQQCVLCNPGDNVCGDPHMQGLRGQHIDWSGVDGGWYCLVKDEHADVHVNVRLTAPLSDEFPDRQLVTGLGIMSQGHFLVIEVKNPYSIETDGCEGVSPCLANGGLRAFVDGKKDDALLRFSRQAYVADVISVSASNLPVECRQFGGEHIWARMYEEMLQGKRMLMGETMEHWILKSHSMAAPEWCAKYLAENNLADLQSTHAIFKIETSTVTVRLNVGVNHQGGDELDWDGRVLPDLEFWQMDVGLDGLNIENPSLSGILGETARPVLDQNGREVMEGFEAFRGIVDDYRVSNALGTHFALLDKPGEGRE